MHARPRSPKPVRKTTTKGIWIPVFSRRGRGRAKNTAEAAGQSITGEKSIEAAVWEMLARKLSSGAYTGSAQDLVRGAERLVGEARWGTLFEGGVTDRLDPQARAVRLFGPVGSGKTTYGRRLVRQAIADGRHATVFCDAAPRVQSGEYTYADVDETALTVINAEPFYTPQHGRRNAETRQELEAIWNDFSTGGPETVVVDASLPPGDLRELAGLLYRALSQRTDTTLVVLTAHHAVFGEESAPIDFDTEIVLAGDQYADRLAVREALTRLTHDDLTYERLAVRTGGGGIAESAAEEQIASWFPLFSREERFLGHRRSRVIEPPLSTITVGTDCARRAIAHGVMKVPDGALALLTTCE